MRRCWLLRGRGCLRQTCDVNLAVLHGIIRTIVARVGGFARDLLHQFHTFRSALPKDRVTTIEVRRWNFGYEELRTVGRRSGVGHREAPGNIELEVR